MSDDIQTVRWFLDKRDDRTAWAALDRIESQNQALQREVEDKAAILNAIEALLDVDDEHTGWDRIVALQQRAEKAEKNQRDALFMAALLIDKAGGEVVVTKQAMVAFDGVLEREDDFDCVIFRIASPTQETDQ